MQFNLIFDSSVANAPAGFMSAMATAAQFLDNLIFNPITVNVQVGWDEVAGQPITVQGHPDTAFFFHVGTTLSYAQLRSVLTANETSATGAEAVNSLPTVDPTNGGVFQISSAQEKAWGMLPANASGIDGSIGFGSSINWNFNPNSPTVGTADFVGIAERELTHVLGRDLLGGLQTPGTYRVLDLFHYSAPGQLNLVNGTTAYFSIDGGNTALENFNPNAFGGDWLSPPQADAFAANDYYYKPFTGVDATAVEVVGFNVTGATAPIEANGVTSLVRSGSIFFLNPVAGETGPELKYSGSVVTAGEFGTWTPIGAEQTATGYDVAWKNTSTGQYTVWSTDSNGNYTANIVAVVAGNNAALESIETTFQQDLNGDGTIGLPPPPPPTIIESAGVTSLVQSGSNFFLNPVAGGTGPELKYTGSVVTVGEFGSWTPIGGEQTATGYDVAWKDPVSGSYTVWSTDSAGNYTGNIVPVGVSNSTALEAIETIFQQDLNGDGTIGLPPPPPPVVIESFGVTSLVEVGNNFFLNPVAGGTGPELKYSGSAVTAGEFGTWTPIGAEQTATGYDVAWKDAGSGNYTVWSTDTSGNYTGNIVPVGPGNSTGLESIETTFQQDLNGDGTVGVPTTLIQTDGNTSLTLVGSNYFLYAVGTTTGPGLKYNASAVSTGEFGTWTPIGAVQTATGYDVAWKNTANSTYTVWSTDSAGNYTGNIVAVGPGNNTALESIETTFNQDLNGDGTIGIPPAVAPSAAKATLTGSAVSDTFVFRSDLGNGVSSEPNKVEISGPLHLADLFSHADHSAHDNTVIAADQSSVVESLHKDWLHHHSNDFHLI
jgi:serralysin